MLITYASGYFLNVHAEKTEMLDMSEPVSTSYSVCRLVCADSSEWGVVQSLLGIRLIAVVDFVSSKLKYWYHGEGNVHFSQELV